MTNNVRMRTPSSAFSMRTNFNWKILFVVVRFVAHFLTGEKTSIEIFVTATRVYIQVCVYLQHGNAASTMRTRPIRSLLCHMKHILRTNGFGLSDNRTFHMYRQSNYYAKHFKIQFTEFKFSPNRRFQSHLNSKYLSVGCLNPLPLNWFSKWRTLIGHVADKEIHSSFFVWNKIQTFISRSVNTFKLVSHVRRIFRKISKSKIGAMKAKIKNSIKLKANK